MHLGNYTLDITPWRFILRPVCIRPLFVLAFWRALTVVIKPRSSQAFSTSRQRARPA